MQTASTPVSQLGKDGMSVTQWLKVLRHAGVLQGTSSSQCSRRLGVEQRSGKVKAKGARIDSLDRAEAVRIFMRAMSMTWESSFHICHEIELDSFSMKFASFCEGLMRAAVATSSSDPANNPAAILGTIDAFLTKILTLAP